MNITLEEALKLVSFVQDPDGKWRVDTVRGPCHRVIGNINVVIGGVGEVVGDVGEILGHVGEILGDVGRVVAVRASPDDT